MTPSGPIVIAHIAKGECSPIYHVIGSNVQLFVVDENAPDDRVYEVLKRANPDIIDELMPYPTKTGNANDGSVAQEKAEVIADAIAQRHMPDKPKTGKREIPSFMKVIK